MKIQKQVMNRALLASIKAWENKIRDVENHKIPAMGPQGCPLCCLYVRCVKDDIICPVAYATGRRYCIGSPYPETEDCIRSLDLCYYSISKTLLRNRLLARAWRSLLHQCLLELDFLWNGYYLMEYDQ